MSSAAKPTTVDEYVAALEEPAAALMGQLRDLVQEELPGSTEALKWNARMIANRLREYEEDGVTWM